MYRTDYIVAGIAVMTMTLMGYAFLGLIFRLWEVPMILGPAIGAAFAIVWTHRR